MLRNAIGKESLAKKKIQDGRNFPINDRINKL